MPPSDPGSQLGPYEIVGPLGEGGMGVVYRARDPRLDREVAIKVLPEAYASDPERLARFEREARTAAGLNHPNLLAVHDVGIHDGSPFLVTELLEGESLRERLGRGPLSWTDARSIAADISRGLVAAHDKGVVHRDLKPENVFVLPDGRAKILDFGLATFSAAPDLEGPELSFDRTLDQLTREGTVVGTIGYMAPEQVAGRPVDARADIFALGVILHEMLTGRQPFRRETSVETLHAILKEEAPEIDAEFVATAPEIVRTVTHCLEKDAASRFQSASDLLFDLEGIGQESGASRATSLAGTSRRWRLSVGAGALVALVALAVVFLPRETGDPPLDGAASEQVAIAVLPFDERGGPSKLDYLGLGLPDEIVTALTYAEGITVRPFADSSRYVAPRPALRQMGRELGADHLVVGQFGLEGDEVSVSVEAVGLADNRVIWRDSWSVDRSDLRALREAVRDRVSSGLLGALGRAGGSGDRIGTTSNDPRAYDLYLRASAMGRDALPNKEAIRLLEQSAELDPEFAPTWHALAVRVRYDNVLSDGTEGGYPRAVKAIERALALDPDLFPARIDKILLSVEIGQHVEAYRTAAELVRRRPNSAESWASMAYALRYGGEVEESARVCRKARDLDPEGQYERACMWSLTLVGDYEGVLEILGAERGVLIVDSLRADVFMRMDDDAAALESLGDMTVEELTAVDLQRGCIQDPRPEGLAEIVADREFEYASWGDPEALYWFAALMARCDLPDVAFRFLDLALDRSYCGAGSGLDNDPLWDDYRSDPRFAAQRERARQCRARFLAEREG